MPSMTRLEAAAKVSRKLGQLAGHLSPTGQGDTQTEGDYTDAVDYALRVCRFDAITEVDSHAKIEAILAAVEYHVLQMMLYHWTSKPTQQQGAGASGLHLMVQTESTIASLRMITKQARAAMETAMVAIGVRLDSQATAVAGTVTIDHEDEDTQDLVYGDHALPWFEEGYWPA